jgi:hypothetical protein
MTMNRRRFARMGAAAVSGALLPERIWSEAASAAASPALLCGAKASAAAGSFRFAVIADTHIIDEFYVPGSENGVEDNTTILETTDHLTAARGVINAIGSGSGQKIEQTFVVGDVFHNYPAVDYDFYFKNKTRIDHAKEILDGFSMPVHVGFGNHDYDEHQKPGVSREMSHRLFEAKLKTKPYYAVDYKGFRFLHLNNFLGMTWDASSPLKMRQVGSFGQEQLNWAEAQLAERRPTVVFVHYPMWLNAPAEVKDYGLHPLLRKYRDTIQIVISGHWHKWIDFAHTYGPQHTVMASTRYDQNALMVFEAEEKKGTVRWTNGDDVQWATHYSKPYRVGV